MSGEVLDQYWSLRTYNRLLPQGAWPLTWKALLANPSPSCRQTTMASLVPQPSLHTVPHVSEPLRSARTSTRPS